VIYILTSNSWRGSKNQWDQITPKYESGLLLHVYVTNIGSTLFPPCNG